MSFYIWHLVFLECSLLTCSGYADRIHELMVVSRELSALHDKSAMQRNGSRNYVTEANYIEFAGVKVLQCWTIHPHSFNMN